MANNVPNSPDNVTEEYVRSSFDHAIRRNAGILDFEQFVRGASGLTATIALAACGFAPLLPLLTPSASASGIVVAWLAGLGGNALAGWLGDWAERNAAILLRDNIVDMESLIQQLSEDLERSIAHNEQLVDELAAVLEQTGAIRIAINATKASADTQLKLITSLQQDLQQNKIIQGRLHRLLRDELHQVSAQLGSKIEAEHILTRDFVDTKFQQIRGPLTALPQMQQDLGRLLRLMELGDHSSQGTAAERVAQAQLDAARKLILDGQHEAARTIVLELYAPSSYQNFPSELQSEIVNILGCCSFGLDELERATAYFHEALIRNPNNWKAMTNQSMIALRIEEYEQAREISLKVRAANSRHANATSVYIQALYRTDRRNELEELLKSEPWISNDNICVAALASVKYESGAYQEAEILLQRVIHGDQHEPQLYVLLANTIIGTLQPDLLENDGLVPQIRDRLEAALAAFSQAVLLYAQRSNRRSLHNALVSRAGVRCLLGDLEAGLSDCERVLNENNAHMGALENKGRILFNSHRTREAIAVFETILERSPSNEDSVQQAIYYIGGRTSSVMMLLASAYIELGQLEKAVDLLNPLVSLDKRTQLQLEIAELLLVAYSRLGDTASSETILQLIQVTWANAPEAKAVMAEYEISRGDNERGKELLLEAEAIAAGRLKRRLALRLAYLLYHEERYDEAVQTLRQVVDQTRDNAGLRLYIVSLYKSHALAEALNLAKFIRTAEGATIGISEIEAQILEAGGDVSGAINIWRQLIAIQPDNPHLLLAAIRTEFRAGHWDEARHLLHQISFESAKGDSNVLMAIARLRALLNLPQSLAYAYTARRIAFADPQMHVQYMLLCLNNRGPEFDEARYAPNVVAVDTTVHLLRNGKTTVFTILDENPVYGERNELSTHDPRAQRLIGKRAADRVVLNEGIMGGVEYEISEIQSKYVYASHQTTMLFEQGVLHHPAFEADDVTNSDFLLRFTQYLEQRAQQEPDVKAFYKERRVPLSTFAAVVHRSLFDVWFSLIKSSELPIFSANGSQVEAESHAILLRSTTSVILDIVTLFTIVHLSLENAIVQRFEHLFISQSVIDELREFEHDVSGWQPTATISSSGGQRYITDIPLDYTENKRNIINKLLDFVTKAVIVLPTMSLIETDNDLLDAIGEGQAASILLAKEQNVPLYSDDLHLRELATNEWHIQCFDTQGLLTDIYSRRIIDRSQYYTALSSLAQGNYRFIRIDADGLLFALEQSGMLISTEVRKLFTLLEGPACDMDSAVNVLAELVKLIWIRPVLPQQKVFLLDLILSTVSAGRKRREVIERLKRVLQRKFQLIELLLIEVIEHINLWQWQQNMHS